ncbi:hypothetical protein QTP88_007405 [Uroleucon formosanum]
MYIALNGIGTALFDPRPAVAKFLESKERRRKLPDPDLYKNQEFIQKFFSIDSNFATQLKLLKICSDIYNLYNIPSIQIRIGYKLMLEIIMYWKSVCLISTNHTH